MRYLVPWDGRHTEGLQVVRGGGKLDICRAFIGYTWSDTSRCKPEDFVVLEPAVQEGWYMVVANPLHVCFIGKI